VPDGRRPLSLWWAVSAAAVLGLVTLVTVLGALREPTRPGTSYDPSGRGFLAAYLLLDELGYPVARSRRASGGDVRWLLAPERSPRQVRALAEWVRDGGRLVLADPAGRVAGDLGLPLVVRRAAADADEEVTGPLRASLRGGPTRVDGGSPVQVWAEVGGRPLVSVHRLGRGEVWLVHRPEFLTNRLLDEADNGLVLCRLAEATLAGRAGPILFDEFFHGYRDRPGVTELLLTPPTLWVTVQALLLLAVVLWRNVPRFGAVRPLPAGSRRSREEFLDALAFLLARRADYGDGYRTARDALRRELAGELGLPADSDPSLVVRQAARYRGLSEERLARLLSADGPPAGDGPQAFVASLRELESLRHDFLARTHPH